LASPEPPDVGTLLEQLEKLPLTHCSYRTEGIAVLCPHQINGNSKQRKAICREEPREEGGTWRMGGLGGREPSWGDGDAALAWYAQVCGNVVH